MKMTNLIATVLFSSFVAATSAFADETVVPVAPVDNGVKQQLNQDKAVVKADRTKLQADKQKLRSDRKAAHMARKSKRKEKKVSEQAQPTKG